LVEVADLEDEGLRVLLPPALLLGRLQHADQLPDVRLGPRLLDLVTNQDCLVAEARPDTKEWAPSSVNRGKLKKKLT
jgi:hypothetical protein